MGKGSKSRITDKKAFDINYENIELRPRWTYCMSCGDSISSHDLEYHFDGFNFYPDGHVEHKICNFN